MKNSFKRALATFLAVVLLFGSAPLSGFVGLELPEFSLFGMEAEAASYSGGCGDNLTWSLDTATGVLEISGTGDMKNWASPSSVPWYSYRSSIETVVIGNSVTSIGDYAFENCIGLTSVTIPDSVTSIGDNAFSDCYELTSVTIGNSVTSIGGNAFGFCENLTSITVDENNPNYSSDEYGVLFNKDKTELIQYPIGSTRISYTIPNGVTSIGNYAFKYCKSLTSVTIPDSVTSIGNGAFFSCTSLTSVTIPDSVRNIGNGAFYDTALYNDSSYWENGVLYIGNHLIKAQGSISGEYTIKPGTKTIADEAFSGCTGLTSVTIGNGVKSIGIRAFYNCTGLTSITIPDSVTSIGNYAFYNCTGLTSVKIGNSVKSIGYRAFEDCTGLTSVTIPDSVTSIGESAFSGCTGLTSVTIGNSVTSIGYRAFENCTGLTSVTIPDSVTSIGDYAFYNCTGLTSVKIGNSVKSIGYRAFEACTGLTDVYYAGTEEDWNEILISSGNSCLTNATIHYSWVPPCSHTSYTEHTTPATCVADGESYKLCKGCGEKFDVTVIPMLEHHAGEWETIKETTYFAPGEKVRECVRCGIVLETAEIPQLELNMSIRNPSKTSISYGDSIILHADFEGTLPEGAKIEWTASNGNFGMSVSEDGTTCKISPKSSGKTVFTATVYDEDGNEIVSASQEMTSKAGFFYKFIAFFKKIFGLSKIIPYAVFGIKF